MAFQRSFSESRPIREPACVFLRSKAMYTTGDMPELIEPDELGSHYFWCNMTQHVIGPDREDVDRAVCIPGRRCFRETYEV